MPLFTVTLRAGRSADEIDRLSGAIHAASVAAGYPADDQFQRFLPLEPNHLRVDPRYPGLPKPRTDGVLIIEALVSSGTATGRKQALVGSLVEHLAGVGVDPNDVMVFFLETDRASGSFGGGQFAPPVVFS
ncbi:MAG: tautomerase family protein [Caulobacteraceae bacterium]